MKSTRNTSAEIKTNRSISAILISLAIMGSGEIFAKEEYEKMGLAAGGGGGSANDLELWAFGGLGGKTEYAEGGEGGISSMYGGSGGGGGAISTGANVKAEKGGTLALVGDPVSPHPGQGIGGGNNGLGGSDYFNESNGLGGEGGGAYYVTDDLTITDKLELAGGDGGMSVSYSVTPYALPNAIGGKGGDSSLTTTSLTANNIALNAGNGGRSMSIGDPSIGGKGGDTILKADTLSSSGIITLISGINGTRFSEDDISLPDVDDTSPNSAGGAGGNVIFDIGTLTANQINITKNDGAIEFNVNTLEIPTSNDVIITVDGNDAANFTGYINTLQLGSTGQLLGTPNIVVNNLHLENATINKNNISILDKVKNTIQLGLSGGIFDSSIGDIQINKPLSGTGKVTFLGLGTIQLTSASQATGQVILDATTLQLNNTNGLASHNSIVMQNAATLNTGPYQQYIQKIDANKDTTINISQRGELFLTNNNKKNTLLRALKSLPRNIVGTINNSGTLTLTDKLYVSGDWNSNNGKLHLNTQGNDAVFHDMLMIQGKTSGITTLTFENISSLLSGTRFIQAQQIPSDAFVATENITGGGLLYKIVVDDTGVFLQQRTTGETIPPDDIIPPSGTTQPQDDITPPAEGNSTPLLASYTGGYLSNLYAASTLFTHNLNDRQGVARYTGSTTGFAAPDTTAMWLRLDGARQKSYQGNKQVKNTSDSILVQGGGEFFKQPFGPSALYLGAMAGYGNVDGTSHANSENSGNQTNGYSIGLYGSWFQDDAARTGGYLDSWLQYGWFNNQVSSSGSTDKYDSSGLSASLESGYYWQLSKGNDIQWFLQPQAQFILSGIKTDSHHSKDGTYVQQNSDNTITTRVGTRLYAKIPTHQTTVITPFIEANWIHNSNNFGMTFNENLIEQDGNKNIAEVKLGIEGKVTRNLSIWGHIGQQIGERDFNRTEGSLGIKYHF